MGETTNLFVYGSLKPGEWNYVLIEPYVRRAVAGMVRNSILVDLGSFPALIDVSSRPAMIPCVVLGIMVEIHHAAAVLALTDRLEGVPHFYRRNETSVILDDGSTTTAWVYEYADPARIADCPRLLLHRERDVSVYAWSSTHK